MSRERQGAEELNGIGGPRKEWRVLWVCGAVLFSLFVVETITGCGRKKPPIPLEQDAAQVSGKLESMSTWPEDIEQELIGG